MPIVCRDHDLMFTHVPKTGGSFVSAILQRTLGGEVIRPTYLSFRRAQIENPPSIRVFTVRDPIAWYRSYWAYARSSMTHPRAWPIWNGGDVRHPTRPLDDRCGHRDFAQFVRNALRVFPDGFLRSVYCDFLNGSTLALRSEQLRDDLEELLRLVGCERSEFVRNTPDRNVTEDVWKKRAVLPPKLERELRETESLEGLAIPYIRPG
jgi:hypothetical protein